MPRVPTYDNYQVTPNTHPETNFQGISGVQMQAPRFNANLPDYGAQAVRVGGEILKEATQMQAEVNQLRVDDAANQLKEWELKHTYDQQTGYTNIRGFDALNRQSGKALSDEYGQSMQEEIERISKTLGNDNQRFAFAKLSQEMRLGFEGRIMAHEAKEFNSYSLEVSNGIISTALNDLALSYQNPQDRENAMTRIAAETYRQAKLLGKPAVWVEARIREAESAAHKLVISTALNDGNLDFASGYLNKYSSVMEAGDILDVRSKIDDGVDRSIAQSAVDGAFGVYASQLNPSSYDIVWQALTHQESGGKQVDEQGNPITSSKGAIGVAQVMPNTAKEMARKYGIEWDENRYRTDAKYNSRLGQLYFNEQLKTFGGDLRKALAAYNAGPGSFEKVAMKTKDGQTVYKYVGVKGAMAQAKEAGNPDNWMAYLPKETQDYVPSILNKIARQQKLASQGVGTPTLSELKNAAYQQAGVGNNPQRRSLVDAAVEKRYKDMKQEQKDEQEQALVQVYSSLDENGGDFNALTPDEVAMIPAGKRDEVIRYADVIRKGMDSSNPAIYLKLTDDKNLKGLSDAEFFALRADLSESDWKQFAKRRQDGGNEKSPENLNTSAFNRILDQRLISAGLDTSTSKNNKDLERVAGIKRTLTESLIDAQKQAGHQFSEEEIIKHIDGWLSRGVKKENAWYEKGKTSLVSPIDMEYDDIPDNLKAIIENDFKAKGLMYTEADVLHAYLRLTEQANQSTNKE